MHCGITVFVRKLTVRCKEARFRGYVVIVYARIVVIIVQLLQSSVLLKGVC